MRGDLKGAAPEWPHERMRLKKRAMRVLHGMHRRLATTGKQIGHNLTDGCAQMVRTGPSWRAGAHLDGGASRAVDGSIAER
jgi:hypothetical protein